MTHQWTKLTGYGSGSGDEEAAAPEGGATEEPEDARRETGRWRRQRRRQRRRERREGEDRGNGGKREWARAQRLGARERITRQAREFNMLKNLREAMEEKYIELGWCNGKDVISSNFCVQWLRVRIPGCAIIRREPGWGRVGPGPAPGRARASQCWPFKGQGQLQGGPALRARVRAGQNGGGRGPDRPPDSLASAKCLSSLFLLKLT
ncbi:hypothetical protein BGW80DRAFT_1508157 [Lactifluus volemus]|nr:hypothetical protein BGW80DRAFT_1508157 [Lactifluus volemus]